MTYDPKQHDGLVIAPENDGFSHETPLRAFTDWQDRGQYAVGRGFRPAVQHLASYLNAIEGKEGWRLVQLLVGDDGRPSAGLFRRRAQPVNLYLDKPLDPAESSRGFTVRGKCDWQMVADFLTEQGVTLAAVDGAFTLTDDFKAAFPRRGEEEEPLGLSPERRAGFEYAWQSADRARAMSEEMDADDPINPRHYGGTHCADIGERLTANCYQVLKYCWRLGEKDDPVQELGKAIWYAAREKLLGPSRSRGSGPLPGMKQDFVLERTEDHPWRREIAMLLWDMCYGFGTPAHWNCAADELIRVLQEKKREMTPSAKP